MGYLSKEDYERRADNAVLRQKRELEDANLTDEQKDAIREICSLRHELHSCDRESIFNSESSDYDELYDIPDRINELIEENDLNKFGTVAVLGEELPADYDWHHILSDEEKEEEYNDNFDNYRDYGVDIICERVEYVNQTIEDFLKKIDVEYNISIAPTGAHRVLN